MRYLDPKNDLTFKKIFGQHPAILMDLLNNLLPLSADQVIERIEYLSPEQVPDIPMFKNSVVDVKCTDQHRRTFIVEMQILWTDSFMSRVVFNASKAYVRQLRPGQKYKVLQPVYALSLIDEVFHPSDAYYHQYQIANLDQPNDQLEDLTFIFVELPKLTPDNLPEQVDRGLWLRFFHEINDGDETTPVGLDSNEKIREALGYLRESAFTRAELEHYDQYWDSVSRERTIQEDATEEAMAIGIKQGRAEGLEQGLEQGMAGEKRTRLIKVLQRGKLTQAEIAEDFEVSLAEVAQLAAELGLAAG
jgi:predicted transposase/invertase (TIGR01784 family)